MIYKIYYLANKEDGIPKYIGITKQTLKKRLSGHIRDKRKNPHKQNWLDMVGRTNVDIILVEDDINTLILANKKEIDYIKLFKSCGAKLLNKTLGGDGTKGFKLSKESILLSLNNRIVPKESLKIMSNKSKYRDKESWISKSINLNKISLIDLYEIFYHIYDKGKYYGRIDFLINKYNISKTNLNSIITKNSWKFIHDYISINGLDNLDEYFIYLNKLKK